MNKKLYVGNLAWEIDGAALEQFFLSVGRVLSATVILDRNTGRSRGFGFVEMETEEDAQRAIKELDGEILGNRSIMVKEARPEDREGPSFIEEIRKFVASVNERSMEFTANGEQFTVTRGGE